MKKIVATPNETKTGFSIPSEYSKSMLKEWLKKYTRFEIVPIITETHKGRRYLEGAVIPSYCFFQYGIDPRDPQCDETRRYLFKRDFHYEIVTNRKGEPVRAPKSSKGQAMEILTLWTEWATENGCPVPSPDLYKLWRDKWAFDLRFPTYFDFLSFLKLEVDAMPSSETLSMLK